MEEEEKIAIYWLKSMKFFSKLVKVIKFLKRKKGKKKARKQLPSIRARFSICKKKPKKILKKF